MYKLLKILGLGLLLAIVFASFMLSRRWINNPVGPYPYPYTISYTPKIDQVEIEKAQILIVGDRLATQLPKYMESIITELSKDLRGPLKMVSLAIEGEGLFRTIHKLKSIKKLPPIVIYHGGADEFYEQKFEISNRKLILGNIETYRNEKINTIVHAFPEAARVIFSPVKYIQFKDSIKKYEPIIDTTEKQARIEIAFKLYQIEVEEFISYIKNQKSRFIVITPPINIEMPPKEPCGNTETPTLVEVLNRIESLIKEGQFKEAYQRLGELQPLSLANAKSYYLLGMATKGIGRAQDARGILYRASAFDCSQGRPTLIGYKILLENMERESVPLIDFNRIVNRSFGSNVLFFDEFIPQGIFYQELMDELKAEIKKTLNL